MGDARRILPEVSSLLLAEQDDGGQAPIASWLRIRGDTAKPIYQQLEDQLVDFDRGWTDPGGDDLAGGTATCRSHGHQPRDRSALL